MKKFSSYLALFVFLMACFSVFSFSQDIDLTGTWEGSTLIPDQGEDQLTFVITKEDGEYAAKITDSMGMLADTECEDIEFEDGTLTFNFALTQDTQSQTIWITLELEGDTLKGYWEDEEGGQGDIELKKQ